MVWLGAWAHIYLEVRLGINQKACRPSFYFFKRNSGYGGIPCVEAAGADAGFLLEGKARGPGRKKEQE